MKKYLIKSFITITSLILFASSAHASSIMNWTYSSGNVYIEGQFETTIDTGLVTENDVISFDYIVYQNNELLFEMDLVNNQVNGSSEGIIFSNFDFEYVIGSNSFEQINSDTLDPDFPIDFTLKDSNELYYGLYYKYRINGRNEWGVDYGSIYDVALSPGFESGPTVSSVPLPPSILFMLSGIVGLLGLSKTNQKYKFKNL